MIEGNSDLKNSYVLVVAKESWNAGVIGIVASRLVEKYYKPTIVLSIDPERKWQKVQREVLKDSIYTMNWQKIEIFFPILVAIQWLLV